MLQFQTSKPSPPMSNTERQRRFRERNPGYYGRLHRKRKAEVMALAAAQRATAAAKPAAPPTLPAKAQSMLPAPTPALEQFTLFDEIQRQREREVVPINRTPTDSI